MLSFFNIWTIARFEVKTLLRSWFFRIFCGLILIILTFLNIMFFTGAAKEVPWMFRGIPASVSYFNMLLLNIAQAVIGVFLATDFLKRDRSDTTEVIYMRSMSNGDYIFGKLSGLFLVFGGLDLLVLLISAIIQIVFSDVPFMLMPHIYYFLLVCLPTLVFIFGLSFLVMSLVRNQAVTFILLLGYIGISLVIINFKYESAFDAVAFFLPLAYSDFIGFSDFSLLLMQRLSFLFAGLGFIFVTILLFKRLPQSRSMQMASSVLAALFLILGPVSFMLYFKQANAGASQRAKIQTLNDRYATTPVCSINRCDLDVDHQGNKIAVTAKLQIENRQNTPLAQLLFSLNPGLIVEGVLWDGNPADFKREIHLITVTPKLPLAVNQEVELEIRYCGTIDETVCHLQTPMDERKTLNSIMLYKADKRSAFITPSFVLLTPETNWYPIAGSTEGKSLLTTRMKEFTYYTLRVRGVGKLLPISQGTRTQEGDTSIFRPETPLPQLSLVIGPYKERSIQVDSVNYHLFTHIKHEYFTPYTTEVGDTLSTIIRSLKNSYEARLGINYPYHEFSLVEVPIHFTSYTAPLRAFDEFIQPMQILVPENGVSINAADFKGQLFRMTNRSQRQNQTMPLKEQQYLVLQRFFEGTFLFSMPSRQMGPAANSRIYSIFPNFYTFTNYVAGNEWPILDEALEIYLRSKADLQGGSFMRFRSGITDEEKANLLLKDKSLQQVLQSSDDIAAAGNVLKSKSNYLFRLLESKMGKEGLESFLKAGLKRYRFQTWPTEDWAATLEKNYGITLNKEYDTWYTQSQTPGFYFSDFKNYSVVQKDRTHFQVKFVVENPTAVDGIIVTDFQLRGMGGGQGGFGGFGGGGGPGFFMQFSATSTDYQRIIQVPAGQAEQVSLLTDEEPRSMAINTVMAQNLPMQISHRFEKFDENNKVTAVEDEVVPVPPPPRSAPDEVIVDNESAGFHLLTQKKSSPLQRLFKINFAAEGEYQPLQPWQVPEYWSKTVNSDFYGDMVLSAHFIRAGDGSQKVAWEAELPAAGQYTVYAYVVPVMVGGRGRRNEKFVQDYHYTVYHDDGAENVQLEADSGDGWTSLGVFYFSGGTAKVELTNQSKGRVVIADAVKWVKR
jgi:ABC-type transport system involved in multi-copper enzyme maturation permease subunit